MEQLSTADQGKVDELNDAIRRLTQENKEAFSARMNLEATKNKLENLLTNNLIRFVGVFLLDLLFLLQPFCLRWHEPGAVRL